METFPSWVHRHTGANRPLLSGSFWTLISPQALLRLASTSRNLDTYQSNTLIRSLCHCFTVAITATISITRVYVRTNEGPVFPGDSPIFSFHSAPSAVSYLYCISCFFRSPWGIEPLLQPSRFHSSKLRGARGSRLLFTTTVNGSPTGARRPSLRTGESSHVQRHPFGSPGLPSYMRPPKRVV
jgi:hypothetical protein